MSPPINIDGSSVSDITIDGTSVSEVTVGGDTVFGNAAPDSKDLHSHFDFRDASGTSSLTDQTGNGYDLSGSYTGPNASINGVQAGEFDGTDDYLDGTWTSVSPPFTSFIVARLDDAGSDTEKAIFDGDGFNDHILASSTSDTWRLFGGSVLDSNTGTDSNPHIFSVLFDGASSVLRVDGNQIASGDAGTPTFDGLTLGSKGGPDTFSNEAIGEMLNYPQDKSAIFSDVESYLSDNWNITI